MLQIALVGCGVIAPQHIAAFAKQYERATLSVFCDLDMEKADRARAHYEKLLGKSVGSRIVASYEEVLADSTVDAVDLCLPHHLHAEYAIAAARAGKHILCEKPLANTLEDCDRMIAAAREAGVVLFHGENMRLDPVVNRAAELIHEGRIGIVTGLQQTYAHWQPEAMNRGWRARPEEAGGGQLMDAAIHHVDILRHVGGEIVQVQAMTTQHRPELGPESEDTGVLNFRFDRGHLGQLFAGHATRNRGGSPLLTVFGTEGSLTLEAFWPRRGLVWFPANNEPQVLIEHHHWQESFDAEIAHFLDVLLEGVPLRATPEEGRRNVEIILAAYTSARTGRLVEV
ncbi:predicted dehydrogenase [Chthonomonas calidirosea]|uniref:Gfo/Idh/MocA family protein n=1 Tax=Chthonomonas calidirosea TaxID=454171 RepID=UPI0006DD3BBF|nr:Gfo/Idh/MocA family oxidoreductase [Chthonomonas calidirosea]CEK15047.1 predicted dehydrogenase [Chthonomonas calidirosea]